MDPIFVKTRHHYGSYDDYWKLVEFSQFPTCFTEDIEWNSTNTYICTYFNFPNVNGKLEPFPEHTCRMIFWDIERWSDDRPVDTRFDEQWISDRWYHERMPGSKFVILGTDGLDDSLAIEKEYDFSTRSYMNGRRDYIVAEFKNLGSTFAPNTMEDKHLELLQSRAMLCMHQDDLPMTEPLRYALAASYGLPILAEASADFFPFIAGASLVLPGDFLFYWLEYPKDNYQFRAEVIKAL